MAEVVVVVVDVAVSSPLVFFLFLLLSLAQDLIEKSSWPSSKTHCVGLNKEAASE
jgi:hypothetical protein